MKTLFLAWQAPESREWLAIGRLMADVASSHYVFEYTRDALMAQDSDVPANRRVLIQLAGILPPGLDPLTGDQFSPISNTIDTPQEEALHA